MDLPESENERTAVEGSLITDRDLEHLRTIHRHLPVVLYCSSYQNGRWLIRYVSDEVFSILGYRPEDLVDRRSWRDLASAGESFYEAIPRQSPANRRYHINALKLRCASGQDKSFSDDGVFIYDQGGRLTGSVGVFVDITDQKRAMEAMTHEYRRLRNLIRRPISLFGMVGNSPVMQEAFSRIIKLAASSANVVVTGESGTGKELAARAIHELGNRAEKPFVAVNCGAISDGLFESEFFGHVKGAFTGALNDRKGYLDLADGGTIFLDEVGEISPALQAKLLRAIDGYGYLPVGGNKVRISNFRLIAATNRDLEAMVKDGTMRKDFYFRIRTFKLNLPPLRDRREDIPMLAHYFMDRLSPSRRQTLSLEVLEMLNQHSWPGNVRELQSVIYRYATFQELDLDDGRSLADDRERLSGPELRLDSPPAEGYTYHPAAPAPPAAETDRSALLRALNVNIWNVSRTADYLGLSRATVYRRMQRLGLTRPVGAAADD